MICSTDIITKGELMGIRTGNMNMSRANDYTEKYVTEGNTVRVVRAEAEPKRRRRISPEEQRRIVRLNREAQRTKTVSLNRPLSIMLMLSVAAVLFTGYNYLCLKSSIDAHMDNVKTLEARLENLRNENDELERSIDTSIDLNHVYDVAVNELGMVHANRNNIIQYDKTESEYVRQYEDIPSADTKQER